MDLKTDRLEELEHGTYVVAVSGGIDSVVLLHMLTTVKGLKLIVAHFDHGIRDDSAEDAIFVSGLAEKYGLTSVSRREELGKKASEEQARDRRYKFLSSVAESYDSKIITAHHSDDIIESIAINLIRGTGWRGLAVMDSDVVRPLLHIKKDDIRAYAEAYDLSWREDSTNKSDAYLRNRIREQLKDLDDDSKLQLLSLRNHQKVAKQEIDREVERHLDEGRELSRYFFTHMDEKSALEVLRQVFKGKLTRPQLAQVLLAIKTSKAGKSYQAGNGVEIDFTSRNFSVKLIK